MEHVANLMSKHGDSVRSAVEAPALAAWLLKLVRTRLSHKMNLDNKVILANSLALWASCIVSDPTCFEPSQSLDDTIVAGLFEQSDDKVREDFAAHLLTLAKGHDEALSYLLAFLSKKFSEATTQQFFTLFSAIVDHYYRTQSGSENIFDAEMLLS